MTMSYFLAETEGTCKVWLDGNYGFPVSNQAAEPREQSRKILEQAAEVMMAVRSGSDNRVMDEACDLLQDVIDLLAAYGMDDIEEPLDRMAERRGMERR